MDPYGFDTIARHVYFFVEMYISCCLNLSKMVDFEVCEAEDQAKRASFDLQGILSFQVEGQFNSCFKSTLFIAFSGQRRLLGAISFEVVSIFFCKHLSLYFYLSDFT